MKNPYSQNLPIERRERTRGVQDTKMKKVYLAPLTKVEKVTINAYLISASTNGEQLLVTGGKASEGSFLEADDKDDLLDIKKIVDDDFEDEMDELW